MTILSDNELSNLREAIIDPFSTFKIEGNFPSWGLSSYGYDVRLGPEVKGWKKEGLHLDPLQAREYKTFTQTSEIDFYIIPGGFLLGHTIEYIRVPSDCIGLVKDKSTYARCGIAVQNTILEPGWEGQVTIEITNHNDMPVRIYVGAGIAQIIFIRGPQCNFPYNGKYQNQRGVTLPK